MQREVRYVAPGSEIVFIFHENETACMTEKKESNFDTKQYIKTMGKVSKIVIDVPRKSKTKIPYIWLN